MLRLILLLLGSAVTSRPDRSGAGHPPAPSAVPGLAAGIQPAQPMAGGGEPSPPPPPGTLPPLPPGDGSPARTGRPGGTRRRLPRWARWAVAIAVLGLIFRRVIAWLVLTALSATLHLAGISVHLPSIKFAWPWQSITTGTITDTELGPSILQKIEGISRPALGQANFSFDFTHRVSRNIGPWPCWYASTFHAVGHASATVDLNPGAAWWKPETGHYRLRVLSAAHDGQPGRVAVTMVLPQPQLPASAHDVAIDNIPSQPISTQHSWTYPGLLCGVVLHPQFPESVLYAQAQQIAFYKAAHVPQVTQPLIRAAETQAVHIIRDNFVQPTLNAFGYTLEAFSLRWSPAR